MSELLHECGVAAVYHLSGRGKSPLCPEQGPEEVSRLIPRMLLDIQNRGQLSAGMTSFNPHEYLNSFTNFESQLHKLRPEDFTHQKQVGEQRAQGERSGRAPRDVLKHYGVVALPAASGTRTVNARRRKNCDRREFVRRLCTRDGP